MARTKSNKSGIQSIKLCQQNQEVGSGQRKVKAP